MSATRAAVGIIGIHVCEGGCGLVLQNRRCCVECAALSEGYAMLEAKAAVEAARALPLANVPRVDVGTVPHRPYRDSAPPATVVDRVFLPAVLGMGAVVFALACVGLWHIVAVLHLNQGPY